jgi:hypothetical protein
VLVEIESLAVHKNNDDEQHGDGSSIVIAAD